MIRDLKKLLNIDNVHQSYNCWAKEFMKKVSPYFQKINDIEVELDKLIEKLEVNPEIEKCQLIKIKVEVAKNIGGILASELRRGKDSNYIEVTTAKYFDEMMCAIFEISGKSQEIKLKLIEQQKKTHLELEQTFVPNIHSFTNLVSSQLRNALNQDNFNINEVNEIIKKNAEVLSKQLYSDEENSLSVKKNDGLRNHYLEILQNHEQLHQQFTEKMKERSELKEEIKRLQAEITELNEGKRALTAANNILENNYKQLEKEKRIFSQQHADSIQLLKADNAALKQEVDKLSSKVKVSQNENLFPYKKSPFSFLKR